MKALFKLKPHNMSKVQYFSIITMRWYQHFKCLVEKLTTYTMSLHQAEWDFSSRVSPVAPNRVKHGRTGTALRSSHLVSSMVSIDNALGFWVKVVESPMIKESSPFSFHIITNLDCIGKIVCQQFCHRGWAHCGRGSGRHHCLKWQRIGRSGA